jgi:hypothetical protein
MNEETGFIVLLFIVAAAILSLFFAAALTQEKPSRTQQIEHNRKLIDPVIVVWKDGSHANCVLYKSSIVCPGFER